MKALAVLGAGGHGGVVKDVAELVGWERITFFDDNKINDGPSGLMNLTNFDALIESRAEFDAAFVAIGDNKIRLSKIRVLMSLNVKVAILIHPSAVISRTARLKEGTLIGANCVVQNDVSIGVGSIVNTNATVEHDVVIGDGVHISPSACVCGSAHISNLAWVGANAVVAPSVVVGPGVVIGAGAALMGNVDSNRVVIGVPAKERR